MGGDATGRRKDEHLDLCLHEEVEPGRVSALFDDVHLVHEALPELSVDDVSTGVELLGRRLALPLVVTGMTGGTPRAGELNRALAQVAQARGLALGLGSQRAMLQDPARAPSWQVRDAAPDVLLFGNLGAVQLLATTPAAVRELLDRTGADALFVHLNPAQELVQPGGDRSFAGCLEAIRRLAGELGPRVWVKETGCGLSRRTAQRLVAAGVGGLDVAGAGGTSWTRVETLRTQGPARTLGAALDGWGIPSAAATAACADLGVPVVASGGLRTGLDLAKALALGATLGGMALPLLRALDAGGSEAALGVVDEVAQALRAALLLTGSRDAAALRARPAVLTGELPRWIEALRSGT
jgi:isopentenyl-diphosphate delta-isomerase